MAVDWPGVPALQCLPAHLLGHKGRGARWAERERAVAELRHRQSMLYTQPDTRGVDVQIEMVLGKER